MSNSISTQQAALIAGISYLMIFIVSTFGNSFALDRILVEGDTAATISNIIANTTLYRFGITCWIAVIIFDIITAWALYILFQQTDRHFAVLMAWFRVIFSAIYSLAFFNLFTVLNLFSGKEYLQGLSAEFLQAQAMLLIEKYGTLVHLSFIFFGIHIGLLAYLIIKSKFVPNLLGYLLAITFIGYLVDSFGNFISASYASNTILFFIFVAIPAVISELSFTIWLLIKGRKVRVS